MNEESKELGRVALKRAPTLTSYIDGCADLRALFFVRCGRRFGLGFGFCGAVDGAVGGLGLQDYGSRAVFPNAQEQEGKGGGGGPQFCSAWNFGFGFPAK